MKTMEKNTVTIMREEFENEQTGEKVEGITIILDGKFKQVIDLLVEKNPSYNNSVEVIKDALFEGINVMIDKTKKKI